jgi:hypothetical protein
MQDKFEGIKVRHTYRNGTHQKQKESKEDCTTAFVRVPTLLLKRAHTHGVEIKKKMKPTRNIVKPSGFWKTKGRVWYQKNDDDKLGKEEIVEPRNTRVRKEKGCKRAGAGHYKYENTSEDELH